MARTIPGARLEIFAEAGHGVYAQARDGFRVLLLEHRGEVINPDELSVQIWGYETFGSRNFVEAHLSRLRSKLARVGAGYVIATMRGVGYVIR